MYCNRGTTRHVAAGEEKEQRRESWKERAGAGNAGSGGSHSRDGIMRAEEILQRKKESVQSCEDAACFSRKNEKEQTHSAKKMKRRTRMQRSAEAPRERDCTESQKRRRRSHRKDTTDQKKQEWDNDESARVGEAQRIDLR